MEIIKGSTLSYPLLNLDEDNWQRDTLAPRYPIIKRKALVLLMSGNLTEILGDHIPMNAASLVATLNKREAFFIVI